MRPRPVFLSAAFIAAAAVTLAAQDGFKLKSKVELVNVTATVSDDSGRFISGLNQNDFTVYEDNEKQEIKFFSAERVPVSLGILLDSSGSMTPDKMESARAAINRFTQELLEPEDELFLMTFAKSAHLLQDWTTDRRLITRGLNRIEPNGGTAMYDAVAEAVPIAASGRHEKKAILVISDGNDTNSRTSVSQLRNMIRESEVMVYALGVDGNDAQTYTPPPRQPSGPRFPIPIPRGGRGRWPGFPLAPQIGFPPIGGVWGRAAGNEHVNESALRAITDDTGGRTEIVRGFGDLGAATQHLADELSLQYYIGYNNGGKKDGKWHAIKVEVRNRHYTVRARKGYVAS